MKSINFSQDIDTIGQESFSYCSSLESVILPNDIQTINHRAFYSCTKLSSVKLPLNCNLQHLYGRAFAECPNLLEITLDPNETNFINDNHVLMTYNKTQIIFFPPSSKITLYVVPAHIQTIGEYSFQGCTNLKSVIIPDGNIKQIDYGAFSGCSKLSFLYLPNSLSTVQGEAFDGCTSLRCNSITYPSEIKDQLIKAGIDKSVFTVDCKPIPVKTCNQNFHSFCSSIQYSAIFLIMLVN